MTHLLRLSDAPHCNECDTVLNIRHVLLNCLGFNHLRKRFNFPSDMASVLGNESDVLWRVYIYLRDRSLYVYLNFIYGL